MKYIALIFSIILAGCASVEAVPVDGYERLVSEKCMKDESIKSNSTGLSDEKYCRALGIAFMVFAKRQYSKIAQRELDGCIFDQHDKSTKQCFNESQDRFYLNLIDERF